MWLRCRTRAATHLSHTMHTHAYSYAFARSLSLLCQASRIGSAHSLQQAFMWFHVFCFFWVNHFILACQCCVIAGAICKWYWTRSVAAVRVA